MKSYQEILETLRGAFPTPAADPTQDQFIASSILRALERIESQKADRPNVDSATASNDRAAADAILTSESRSLDHVISELVECFDGCPVGGQPLKQTNIEPSPTIASIVGVVLSSLFAFNLCSDETSGALLQAEKRAVSMVAQLVGYDPQQSAGLFTFGGTGTLLYGVKIGLEKAIPDCLRKGMREDAVIIASDHSHSACLNVAGWLGIGQDHVLTVPTHLDNSIDIGALEETLRDAVASGKKIAAVVATMGTTDAFGIDDLAAIHALRERLVDELALDYCPHIHADAVVGWAWSVFGNYDHAANPHGFSGRASRAIAGITSRMDALHLADTLGVDFHKSGFTPYISSAILTRDRRDFERLLRNREDMPYLFNSGECHPGLYTLETSRAAGGPMAALASMLLLGRHGFQVLLGHAVEMAEAFREQVSSRPELAVLNDENFGPVTLFRVYPDGVDTFGIKHRERTDTGFCDQVRYFNQLNERIYHRLRRQALSGDGVAVGLTRCYRSTDQGEPILSLKSYVLSPFAEPSQMDAVVQHVLAARRAVLDEDKVST
jgi:L-2,4-diaminobutyrate decarboxylase